MHWRLKPCSRCLRGSHNFYPPWACMVAPHRKRAALNSACQRSGRIDGVEEPSQAALRRTHIVDDHIWRNSTVRNSDTLQLLRWLTIARAIPTCQARRQHLFGRRHQHRYDMHVAAAHRGDHRARYVADHRVLPFDLAINARWNPVIVAVCAPPECELAVRRRLREDKLG